MSYTKENIFDVRRDIVDLEKRCSEWHSHRGLTQLLLIAGALVIVAEVLWHSTELGRTGLGLVGMLTIGGFFYYLGREEKDSKNYERLRHLEDLLKRVSVPQSGLRSAMMSGR